MDLKQEQETNQTNKILYNKEEHFLKHIRSKIWLNGL